MVFEIAQQAGTCTWEMVTTVSMDSGYGNKTLHGYIQFPPPLTTWIQTSTQEMEQIKKNASFMCFLALFVSVT